MASKFTGRAGAIKVEDGDDFDPQSGWQYYEIWRGPKAAIIAKRAQFINGGWKVKRQKWTGPVYQLQATAGWIPGQGNGSGSEVPVDRYRITTELAQLDLRSNPKLIASAGSEGDLAQLLHDVDEALSKGLSLAELNISPIDVPTFNLRARGQTAYEQRRPVLTRIRTVSVNYPNQFVIEPQPVVYKTAALKRVFAIPAVVVRRLPPDPALRPSDTEWGWMWRQQDSDIVSRMNRVEEMDSWVFAAWSTATYDVVAA